MSKTLDRDALLDAFDEIGRAAMPRPPENESR
jgi:hypothetical protein